MHRLSGILNLVLRVESLPCSDPHKSRASILSRLWWMKSQGRGARGYACHPSRSGRGFVQHQPARPLHQLVVLSAGSACFIAADSKLMLIHRPGTPMLVRTS